MLYRPDLLFHQQYPTQMCGKVTPRTEPADTVPTVTRLAPEPRGNGVSASIRRRRGWMEGRVTTGELSCAVITNNVLLVTRRGFGGHPLGQPSYLRSKDEGTRAWRQSRKRREGAEIADLQDLHDVVRAAWPEAQFPVGSHIAYRQSASRRY